MTLTLLPIYTLLIVLGGSLVLVLITFLGYIINRERVMKRDIKRLLKEIAKENKILNYKLKRTKRKAYDIYYETLSHVYYIKVLRNYHKSELYIKNRNEWYLKKQVNEGGRLLSLNEFIYLDTNDGGSKKEIEKILLVYPNAKAIISYINPCELNFVYDDEKIYGLRVITYENLYNRHNIIEGR